MDRISSGNPSLDQILDGGLPANAITLLMGLPGTGKTMLAQQFVFQGATTERPALYLATASEPFEKIVRYGQELAFFDPSAVGSKIFYEDLARILSTGGLDGVLTRIVELLHTRRPAFLVIDSFKALSAFADTEAYRRFVSDLAGHLTAARTNTFWVGEWALEEQSRAPEFAIADSIIALDTEWVGLRQSRSLLVLKLRGSGFRSGRHAYRLSRDGFHAFPRLADVADESGYELSSERLSTGLPELDHMLEGGFLAGSTTLVAGPSGSGKTMLGLHFLSAGAARGEPVLLATFQENATQIHRALAGFAGEAEIQVMYRSPIDVYIDEWVFDLSEAIRRTGSSRVVVDSLSDLRVGAADEVRLSEHVYSLSQRCSRSGVTLMYTLETLDLSGAAPIASTAISHLSDNLILLRYVSEHGRTGRRLSVLKTRATHHDPGVRSFEIGSAGIVVDSAAAETARLFDTAATGLP